MRFQTLKIWLLVTAVIASLSLVSCKKDCGESGSGNPNAYTPRKEKRYFWFYGVEKGTGKTLVGLKDSKHPEAANKVMLLHDIPNTSGQPSGKFIKQYSIHPKHGCIYGPVEWPDQAGRGFGFAFKKREGAPLFQQTDLDTASIGVLKKGYIAGECDNFVWYEYFLYNQNTVDYVPPGPPFHKGNGLTDTIAVAF